MAYPSSVATDFQAQLHSGTAEIIDGIEGLSSARVMIVGAGALGSVAAGHLASSGVGLLGLVDEARADVLAARLAVLEPDVQADPYPARLESSNAEAIITGHHLVVDCSNSDETRLTVNDACIALGVPLVTAILGSSGGSLVAIRPGSSACFGCIAAHFSTDASWASEEARVARAPLAGLIGSLEAIEAVKLLTGEGVPLLDRILRVNALAPTFEEIVVTRRAGCPSCGNG